MNWSPAPGDASGYGGTGASAWATTALPAIFSGSTLTLSPNVNTYNATDPYWVNADGSGANIMDANMYVQNDALAGQTVNFQGTVLSYTLASPYTSVAFIKDFVPDYSSFTQTTYDLSLGGNFSINLATSVGDHIQYGFETVGPDANPATVASLGSVVVQAVPEPTSLVFMGLALAFPLYLRKLRVRRA